MPQPSKVEIEAAFKTLGFVNDPATISKLLRALAGSELAKTNRHDTILIGAAEMIDRFATITRGTSGCPTGEHGKSRSGAH